MLFPMDPNKQGVLGDKICGSNWAKAAALFTHTPKNSICSKALFFFCFVFCFCGPGGLRNDLESRRPGRAEPEAEETRPGSCNGDNSWPERAE